ncbi:MAG: DNA repair protein RecO [Deltaproteobacteria bacterium CG2_30_63_29]|nr:MAG: DNA repair protein RecO [Deltaproteobacteria bacterium CG2_30_63_29]
MAAKIMSTESSNDVAAILLRVVDYSEKDQIVTFFGAGCGKSTAFARAARGSTRRFAGGLVLFCMYELTLLPRRDGLPMLTQATALESLPRLSGTLEKIAVGSAVLELLRETTEEHDPNDRLLYLVWSALKTLEGLPAEALQQMRLTLRWLELQLLSEVGVGCSFALCVRCGAEGGEEPAFGVVSGGVLCARCQRPSDSLRPISSRTLRGLERLSTSPLAEVVARAGSRAGRDLGEGLKQFNDESGKVTREMILGHASGAMKAYEFLDSLIA